MIIAEFDGSLPRHWTRLERPWTTIGQPKPCETSTRAVVRRALVAESGKKGRVRGSEADLGQCGALALPPPLSSFVAGGAFFSTPPYLTEPVGIRTQGRGGAHGRVDRVRTRPTFSLFFFFFFFFFFDDGKVKIYWKEDASSEIVSLIPRKIKEEKIIIIIIKRDIRKNRR